MENAKNVLTTKDQLKIRDLVTVLVVVVAANIPVKMAFAITALLTLEPTTITELAERINVIQKKRLYLKMEHAKDAQATLPQPK